MKQETGLQQKTAGALMQITKENWLQSWNEIPAKADMPLAEVIKMGTPAISTFNRGTGSLKNSQTIFGTVLTSILEFQGANWSTHQSRELAEMLASEYNWLSFAELKNFSLKAKLGTYNVKEWVKDGKDMEEWDGKIYGTLTPPVLLKWFARFAAECLIARQDHFIEKSRSAAPTERDIMPYEAFVPTERVSAAFRELIAQMDENRAKLDKVKADEERVRVSEARKAIDALINEFLEFTEYEEVPAEKEPDL